MQTKEKKVILLLRDGRSFGGREKTLYGTLKKDKSVRRVLCVPGNDSVPQEDRIRLVDPDFATLLQVALNIETDLVVVGSERLLVEGIVDYFGSHGGPLVFGPSRRAAQLEGSKSYLRELCHMYDIPGPDFRIADNPGDAISHARKWGTPLVVKADGLCGGQGVVVAETWGEIAEAIKNFMVNRVHGEAGSRVVLEEKLIGRECSVMAICDGKRSVLLEAARDYKRLKGGPEGSHNPNTGGMGAYSPLPDVSGRMLKRVKKEIINPLLAAMRQEGFSYHGVLYAGIMITEKGPMLLEVNCRFGDPEAQAVLSRLKSDLVPYLLASIEHGGLSRMKPLQWRKSAAVCVCLADKEYPKAGHRLQSIVGMGRTVAAARKDAYRKVEAVPNIEELQYRDDIAAGV